MAKSDKNWLFVPLKLVLSLLMFLCFQAEAKAGLLDNILFPDASKMSLKQREDYVLGDRNGLVSETFMVPRELRDRVSFWYKIYSQYSIENMVIHDLDHPWIIYDVINAQDLRKRSMSGSAVREAQRGLALQRKAEYRAILLKLSKGPKYTSLNGREKRIYHLFDEIKGDRKHLFLRAAYRVRLQKGQRDSLIYGLRKSGRYWTQMEEALKEENVPTELLTISLLESSFVVDARSKAGATGVWQFMYATGKQFFKYVRSDIDERYDPLKATHAAAQLFKHNLQMLGGEWPLAVNAFNTGPGALLNAKKKMGTDNIATIVNEYRAKGWGFASRNYYPMFLATLHVSRYNKFLFNDIERDPPLNYDDEIRITYPMRALYVMKICKIDQKQLRLYNPDLRDRAINSQTYLPENYDLKLPIGHRKYMEEFHREVEEVNKKLDKLGVAKE